MNDPEFVNLRNRFFMGIGFSLLFIIPIIIFMVRKFNVDESKIIKDVNEKNNIVVLVENGKCTTCNAVEDILKEKKVKYEIINSDTSKDYKTILKKLNITTTDIDVPTLIYIEEGEVNTILPSIKTEQEIKDFIEFYNLGK